MEGEVKEGNVEKREKGEKRRKEGKEKMEVEDLL